MFKEGSFDSAGRRKPMWWLWDGWRSWPIGDLTPAQYDLPFRGIYNPALLVEYIEMEWTVRKETEAMLAGLPPGANGDDDELTEPGGLRHFFYVSSPEEAKGLAAILTDDGFDVDVDEIEPGQWAVYAGGEIPGEDEINELRRRFERLARDHHGEYDGWEMALPRP